MCPALDPPSPLDHSRAGRGVAAAVLLLATGALAHDADLLLLQMTRESASGELHELLTLTATSIERLAPLDRDRDGQLNADELQRGREAIELGVWEWMPLSAGGAPCRRLSSEARLKETFLELEARFRCGPGELRQTFRVLSVLPQGYRVVLRHAPGTGGQLFAEGSRQTLVIPAGEAGAASVRGWWGWVRLGLFHIFTGLDHLCFLWAILLVGGSFRRVLLMVTAFTLAHSLTLGATALELVQLSPRSARWVEAAIAASIVWVAVENLVLRQHRHRALVTFAFGLVHGFGFASVLKGYGLGEDAVAGLFGFNLGVELGQACLVSASWPLVRLLARRPQEGAWVVRLGSLAVLLAGGYWLWERLSG